MFDGAVNGEHTIVHELDIFSKVGRGVAHDEIIPFSIRNFVFEADHLAFRQCLCFLRVKGWQKKI